ncbi:MAG: ABC transporter ATP-binding protein [Bdellovibrionaceae bacterium]|jgi:putative ABC transport system ATP-binding protein|nr:ABC transporter ATP-binding protein [Pseudobdellovibrionaceae bacterium]
MHKINEKIVLGLKGIRKTYEGPPAVTALSGIDLQINKGDFAAIVGPSGSGKSTLLNIASGLEKPSVGQVLLDGIDLATLSREQLCDLRRQSLSFIFQSFNLFPVLSAVENVEFTLLIRGDNKKAARQKARESLELVGLGDRWKHLPSELSGGQQQRVAVARALALQPSIVFADEPTANLDSKNALSLIDLFVTLNKSHHMTFLISTHDHRVVDRASRKVEIMDGLLMN